MLKELFAFVFAAGERKGFVCQVGAGQGAVSRVRGLTFLPCAMCRPLAHVFHAVSGRHRSESRTWGEKIYHLRRVSAPSERICVPPRGGSHLRPLRGDPLACRERHLRTQVPCTFCGHAPRSPSRRGGGRGRRAGRATCPAQPRRVRGGSPRSAADQESSGGSPGAGPSSLGVCDTGSAFGFEGFSSCVLWLTVSPKSRPPETSGADLIWQCSQIG